MKKSKKKKVISVIGSILLVAAVLLIGLVQRQELQGKERADYSREVTFQLSRNYKYNPSDSTWINNVKFQLQVKNPNTDDWETATKNGTTTGTPYQFITKDNGRVRLLETEIRELEANYNEKWNANPSYRFIQMEAAPGYLRSRKDGLNGAIGKTTEEFKIPVRATNNTANGRLTLDVLQNQYLGLEWNVTVEDRVTGKPISGATVMIQTAPTNTPANFQNLAPTPANIIPAEMKTNDSGMVTLDYEQLNAMIETGYTQNGDKIGYYRFVLTKASDIYWVPSEGQPANNAPSIDVINGLTPTSSLISVSLKPTRNLTLEKRDIDANNTLLSGAEFDLEVQTKSGGAWTQVNVAGVPNHLTTVDGKANLTEANFAALETAYGLDANYRFKETKAPAGYESATDTMVSAVFYMEEQDGSIVLSSDTIQMYNRKLPTGLTLEKKDAITGKRLAGVVFVLERKNGANWTQVGGNYTTDANGEIKLDATALTNLADGDYRFRETHGITGYEAPTAESVTEEFSVAGNTVSTRTIKMTNEPLEKGKAYVRITKDVNKYKYDFDEQGGKGYATKTDGDYGIIRSNDTLTQRYGLAFADNESVELKNLKVKVTAEILDGRGFSDYGATKPLQNASLDFDIPSSEKTEDESDETTKIVKASTTYTVDKVQGTGTTIDFLTNVKSAFNGTKLPLHYTLDLISAEDKDGNKIIFADEPNPELYHYELETSFPSDELTVSSQLSMIPKVAGSSAGSLNAVQKKPMADVIAGSTLPEVANTSVASVGYGWRTIELPRAASFIYTNTDLGNNRIPFNLGLAVARGDNHFDLTLDQDIRATLSDGSIKTVRSELDPIRLLGYGAFNQDINHDALGNILDPVIPKSKLSTGYNAFRTPIPAAYTMGQDGTTSELTANVQAPTLFSDTNGYTSYGEYIFGIASYLTYPNEAAPFTVSRISRATSDVTKQEYTVKITKSAYKDNDGDIIENPDSRGQTLEQTWTETFKPGTTGPTEPETIERHLVLDKEDANDRSLIQGAKFVLQYRDGKNGEWQEVADTNFPTVGLFQKFVDGRLIFETNVDGQIVLDEGQLQFLYATYITDGGNAADYPFRFLEIAPPDGYKDLQTLSSTFVIYDDTIEVNGSGNETDNRLIVKNYPIIDEVWYQKVNVNNSGLNGAEFELEYRLDEKKDWITVDVAQALGLSEAEAKAKLTSKTEDSKNGMVFFTPDDLAKFRIQPGVGEYRLKETKSPNSYIIPENPYSRSFTLTAGDVYWTDSPGSNPGDKTSPSRIVNNQIPYLTIYKYQDSPSHYLSGATFELQYTPDAVNNPANPADWTWETVDIASVFGLNEEDAQKQLTSGQVGGNGRVLSLLTESTTADNNLALLIRKTGYGQYRLEEKTAPPGYILPNNPYTPLFMANDKGVFKTGTDKDAPYEPAEKPSFNGSLSYQIFNQKEAVLNTTKNIQALTAYGYSIEDEDGEAVFSPTSVSYTAAPTLQQLQESSQKASTVSRNVNNQPQTWTSSNLQRGGFGKVLRGEEITVGSHQSASYATSMDNQPNEYTNWDPKEATLFQFWNPKEGEFLEAGVDYFKDVTRLGNVTYLYGVRKTTSPYTWTTDAELKVLLNQTTVDDYDWYVNNEAAKAQGEISAVQAKLSDIRLDSEPTTKLRTFEWNLYTKRSATGSIQELTSSRAYTIYNTITRSSIIYQNPANPSEQETLEFTSKTKGDFTPTAYSMGDLNQNNYGVSTLTGGDSLLILPYYRPKLEKKAYDAATKKEITDSPRPVYLMSNNILWGIQLTFPSKREGTNWIQNEPFTFELEDYVNYSGSQSINPLAYDHFSYVKGSSTLNGLPYADPIYDGVLGSRNSRYLRWEVEGNVANTTDFLFQFEGMPMRTGIFTNRAYVNDTYFGTVSADKTVEIKNVLAQVLVGKTTSTAALESSTDPTRPTTLSYQLSIRNLSTEGALERVRLVDVLPYNGDERGYGGPGKRPGSLIQNPDGFSYRVKSVTATNATGEALNPADVVLYYTSNSGETLGVDSIEPNPNDIYDKVINGEDGWKQLPTDGTPTVTALYATLPPIPAGSISYLDVELEVYGITLGDRYFNTGGGAVLVPGLGETGVPLETESDPIESTVVERKMSGSVWIDEDYNGIMESGEERVPNTEVQLFQYNKDGELEKVAIDPVFTDQDGNYEFVGLPAGYYFVGFKLPEEYKDYLITLTNVEGGNPLLTNKVDQLKTIEVDDALYHLTTESVFVPYTLFDEDGNQILEIKVPGINMGILSPPKMKVEKSVFDKNGEDIAGKKVKIGDTIRYQIDFTNEGSSTIADVHLHDVLPVGLELNTDKKVYLKEEGQADRPLAADDEFTYLPVLDEDDKPIEPAQYVLDATLGDVATGKTLSIYFDVKVTNAAEGKLTNVATATASVPPGAKEPEPSEVTNCDTPLPSLTKTSDWDPVDGEDNKGLPQPGVDGKDIITYTLKVTNAAGASTWRHVKLTDLLNEEVTDSADDYLAYVAGSTKLDGTDLDDSDVWSKDVNGRDQLTVNLGDFEGSEVAQTKTIVFKVKLLKQPPEDGSGKTLIKNHAKVIGQGLNCEDEEKDFEAEATNILGNSMTTAKLHVRQLVINNTDRTLVIPSEGYVNMVQTKNGDGTDPIAASVMMQNINSNDIYEGGTFMPDTFTNFRVPLLAGEQAMAFDLIIPEYYEYMGAAVTDDIEIPSQGPHYVAPDDKDRPFVVPLKDNDEKWITLFIQPKYADGENTPRPYSWGYAVNDFGKLKLGQ